MKIKNFKIIKNALFFISIGNVKITIANKCELDFIHS